ncbi:MAG: ribonuclease III [Lachnospiraceae bacterium]|nr:ribonuclease III [Lachnospiraceae bacterium]MBR4412938.1 ribonuclease III [Lachnospiraceae bacterium]MBR5067394.1 ribonuclease III [Lachnospiraceae bacterium]
MTDLPSKIKEQFDIKDTDINTYNPLTLAFIGDSVYETIVRTIAVSKGNKSVNALAKDKNKLVNAKTQSRIAEILTEYYTEEEADIYRRGKNAKTANHSKSAAYSEYHRATGLEAVFGYLYLTGNLDRCLELLKTALEKIEE